MNTCISGMVLPMVASLVCAIAQPLKAQSYEVMVFNHSKGAWVIRGTAAGKFDNGSFSISKNGKKIKDITGASDSYTIGKNETVDILCHKDDSTKNFLKNFEIGDGNSFTQIAVSQNFKKVFSTAPLMSDWKTFKYAKCFTFVDGKGGPTITIASDKLK